MYNPDESLENIQLFRKEYRESGNKFKTLKITSKEEVLTPKNKKEDKLASRKHQAMKKSLSNSNNNIKEESEKFETKEDTISNQEKQEEKLPTKEINEKRSYLATLEEEKKENSPVKTNVETITKSDYIGMLELLKTPIFNKMKDVLTIKETVIISLKFGYIDEKYFSDKAIAEFLGIEQNEVIEISKKALLLYKENINKFIDHAIEVITENPSKLIKTNQNKSKQSRILKG